MIAHITAAVLAALVPVQQADTTFAVDAGGRTTIHVDGLGGDNEAIVVISGLTPVTTEGANYEYWFEAR